MVSDPSDLDAIADSLSRIRGRRPAPPFGGPFGGPHTTRHGGPAWGRATPGGDTDEDGEAAHPGRRPRHGGEGHGWGPPGRFGGPARMRMLEALAAASAPLGVSELGAAIGVDQPRASRLIQQSVALGFVRREADPDDARRTRVALTDAGAALVRGIRGERRTSLAAALDGFSEAERAELARLLGKLADAWPRD